MSEKCNSYTANFKLQVIAFAENLNNSMSAFLHYRKTGSRVEKKCMHSMIMSHICSLKECALVYKPTSYFSFKKILKNSQLVHRSIRCLNCYILINTVNNVVG